ncbi:SH3 domain-containing protein [bacterium A37T11]|nr:SH3 domain-containing protein [bacterium A37T11]
MKLKKINRVFNTLGFLYCLTFGLLMPIAIFADIGSDAQFAAANAHYAKGEYEAALKGYEQLVAKGVKAAPVYYNLGNAQYKLNNLAEAILNYERAYKLNPADKDIAANLRFVNQRITDKIEAVPELFLSNWWHSLLLSYSLHTWAAIGAFLTLIGFLLLAAYLFVAGASMKRVTFYSGVVFIVLAVFSLTMAFAQYSYLNGHQQAIIYNGTVNVKSSPNLAQKTLFVIHEGTKVTLLEHADSWIKVELPNGNVGWIEENAARKI